jgi:hypothetical protein
VEDPLTTGFTDAMVLPGDGVPEHGGAAEILIVPIPTLPEVLVVYTHLIYRVVDNKLSEYCVLVRAKVVIERTFVYVVPLADS